MESSGRWAPFDADVSRERCRRSRERILEMSQRVTALHMAPAFSCIEIVDAVYFGLMLTDDGRLNDDVFIVSKGHGYLGQLVALEALGVVDSTLVEEYCTPGGLVGAHPDLGVPGIPAATGSLGHGLGMGLGMAIAMRNSSAPGGEESVVHVLLSDGELQEGSTWESVILASSLGLSNVVAIVDNNDFQSLGRTSDTHPSLYPLEEKFASFGWEVATVNGHDTSAIVGAVRNRTGSKPLMVVARTTKGKGVSYMENKPIWHYRSPDPAEYAVALAELAGA